MDYCYDQVITALVTTYDITPILHLKILIRVRKLFLQSTIINIGNKRIQNISHIIAGLKSILHRYRLDIIRVDLHVNRVIDIFLQALDLLIRLRDRILRIFDRRIILRDLRVIFLDLLLLLFRLRHGLAALDDSEHSEQDCADHDKASYRHFLFYQVF